MSCKGLCASFPQIGVVHKADYIHGFKWCSVCSIGLTLEQLNEKGLRCKCCNTLVRSRPYRRSRHKKRYGMYEELKPCKELGILTAKQAGMKLRLEQMSKMQN